MIDAEMIKADLLSLDTRDFYIKYIVKSKYWYFSDYLEVPGDEVIDVLDRFKEIVSEHFHISFHSLQLVGSAKTGFSLSPNKILTPFHDGDDTQKSSDIDIAIISESLYQYYWNKMRQTEKIQYKRFYQQLTRFKEIVSEHFHISFHSLQLVGSAKTGFSLSPNKILTPFHDGDDTQKSSDIDIAIISESLYQYYWNKMRQTEKIQYKRFYQQLTASIFRGYINDKVLMEIPPIRTEWLSVVAPINKLLQDELMIVHPITYRIYRSWEDLEEYQIIGIEKTKKNLEG